MGGQCTRDEQRRATLGIRGKVRVARHCTCYNRTRVPLEGPFERHEQGIDVADTVAASGVGHGEHEEAAMGRGYSDSLNHHGTRGCELARIAAGTSEQHHNNLR